MTWWLATVVQDDATTSRLVEARFRPSMFLCEQHVFVRGRYRPCALRPIYPNYLFVEVDPRRSAKALVGVKGVVGLVRAEENEVAEVRDEVVLSKQSSARRLDDFRWVLQDALESSQFRVGDRIECPAWPGVHRVKAILGDGFLVVLASLFGKLVEIRVREAEATLVARAEAKSSRRFRKASRKSSVRSTPASDRSLRVERELAHASA